MLNLRLMTAFLFAGAVFSFAAEHDQHGRAMAGGAARSAQVPVLPQKTCPVTGKPIKNLYVDYEGHKVYFCCDGCPAKFQASPGKYLPALYRQIYPQRVQVKCLVMGDAVDHKVFVDYKGQRVYFCCDACPKKFNAAPDSYLPKLAQAMTDQVHCPVTGQAIDPQVSTDYKGKTIYFNSEDALAQFKANPLKYAAALQPEVGVVARGPVAGDDLILTLTPTGDANTQKRKDLKATSYEGKTYCLQGDNGVRSFQADPGKYAKALAAEIKKRSPSQGAPMPATGKGAVQGQSMDHKGMKHGG